MREYTLVHYSREHVTRILSTQFHHMTNKREIVDDLLSTLSTHLYPVLRELIEEHQRVGGGCGRDHLDLLLVAATRLRLLGGLRHQVEYLQRSEKGGEIMYAIIMCIIFL